MIKEEILNRKGARKPAEVPSDILELLNKGQIVTVNLSEWLAVDQTALLCHFLKEVNVSTDVFKEIEHSIQLLKKQTVNTVNERIGQGLYQYIDTSGNKKLFDVMSQHTSDIVRGWAVYVVSNQQELSITEQLDLTKPFAADGHFGVRELAWLSMRPVMVKALDQSIKEMEKWALSVDENVRRFASESLRPRGVWCAHINDLKENPNLAINILEPLKNDSSKYVRDSVGNWINDASKTAPDWVEELCERWESESDTKETRYIIKKGLRTLRK